MRADMEVASRALKFEKAARIRDQLKLLEDLALRGNLDENVQPEVFFVDPRKGLAGLQKIFQVSTVPRRAEGGDIPHLGGAENRAPPSHFIQRLPLLHAHHKFSI